mmetsp:Transcript_93285/g.253038  ORF Transcript_93285/g.253038 Transcript_93285/m.253038 type:complete len:349 (-) Transcript_93285:62-1108(-)
MSRLPVGCLLLAGSAAALRRHDERAASRASEAACKPEKFGQEGRWVDTGATLDWDDKRCGRLPELDVAHFCSEKLQCKDLLVVGDSTSFQFYRVMNESLNQRKQSSGNRVPPTMLLNMSHGWIPDALETGFNSFQTRPVKQSEFFMKCKEDPEKNTREQVCQDSCPKPVTITYMRHDHLNGPEYSWSPKSACEWYPELDKHEWVVLSYGTHVNDHTDLLYNKNGIWEKRAEDLFRMLKEKHPHGLIWRTAYYGLTDYSEEPCPNKALVKAAPLTREQIADKFNDSWKKIAELNKLYKEKLQEAGLQAVVLDIENLFSMRPDCRKDYIHYGDIKQSVAAIYPRMMQYLM